jgi:thermostable 8-oxoguanine DNA glycosylase
MNCREELREYLLVERMRRWLSRARFGQDYERQRSRKNYLALIRKFRALAERHKLSEKSLF